MAKQTSHTVAFANPVEGVELVRAAHLQIAIPRHIHASYCIGVIEAGARQTLIRGQNEIIPAGFITVVNPGEAHTCAAAHATGQSYSVFNVTVDLALEVAAGMFGTNTKQPLPYFPAVRIQDPALFAGLSQLAHDLEGRLPDLEAQTRFLDLLARLMLRHARDLPSLPDLDGSQRAVALVRDYIDAHYDQDITLDDLARLAALSPFHLVRLFTRVIGIPPHTYQILVRLKYARRLLRQDMNIAETAALTGFFDQSHFTNTFKKYLGATPGRFIARLDQPLELPDRLIPNALLP